MDHAWLDSLSEDWVSQPRSSGSPAPSLPSLPSLSDSTSEASNEATKSSRIPKYDAGKHVWIAPSNKPLSERNANDYNLPNGRRSVRLPMKAQDGNVPDVRGRTPSRTLSASTTSSVAFGTVAHKSLSLSPRKGDYETPEWKRRLLQGDVAYGEQKDLFSPAGLENIFRPPPAHDISADLSRLHNLVDQSVMPSSPPPYNRATLSQSHQSANKDVATDQNPAQQHNKEPRTMKYQLVDDGDFEHSLSEVAEDRSMCADGQVVSAKPLVVNLEEMRTVSGQSEMRHEEFSPVYVGRPTSIEDALNLGPSSRDLRSRLEQVQDHTQSHIIESNQPNSLGEGSEGPSHIFPDNRFVNLRRGGYSQDGSFQQRLLSLSSLPGFDESAMLAEGSIQASTPKILAHNDEREGSRTGKEEVSVTQPLPAIVEQHTPHTSPKRPTSNQSGGSPLKLFGNYDTFTNQKLLRRLSQFELNQAGMNNQDNHREVVERRPSVQMGNFGKGELDDFEFSDEKSFNLPVARRQQTDPQPAVTRPISDHTFTFNSTTSDDDNLQVLLRQKMERVSIITDASKHTIRSKKTIHHIISSSPVALNDHNNTIEGPSTPRRRNGGGEGKRLPRSPLKDSTPKRRRTLQKADFTERLDDASHKKIPLVSEAHHQIQSVVGRKRKDARPGHDQQTADPVILAMRQILRPRNPTPSQRPSSSREDPNDDMLKNLHPTTARNIQAQKLADVQAQLDAYESNVVTQNPAALIMGMQNDSRKGSVTTQDFLNEAKLIMAGIRGKARSGLASLEESESENDRNQTPDAQDPDPLFEDSYQESTQEPFSRPPSREGKPIVNQSRQQQDPALLDYLRKYQERSEIDLAATSSVKIPTDSPNSLAGSGRLISGNLMPMRASADDIVESDPPNVVISENPDAQRKRKHSISSSASPHEYQIDGEYNSQGSNASSGQSTGHSIPTGSSRNSDSRRIIAPHTVSHLIPEQLAGMFLDKEKNIWIKRKSATENGHGENYLPSDESEEDPFGDIPDLSVDETQELRRLRAVAAKKLEDSLVMHLKQDALPNLRNLLLPDVGQPVRIALNDTLPTDMLPILHRNAAVHERQYTSLTSPIESVKMSTVAHVSEHERIVVSETTSRRDAVEEEIEAEISVLEDRVPATPPQRRRNVTISFSSPLAQIISSATYEDHSQLCQEAQNSAHANRVQQAYRKISTSGKSSTQKLQNSALRSALRAGNRHISLGGELFVNRPVSRIDERDEEAAPLHPSMSTSRSVSVVVSTPLPAKRETSLIAATPLNVEQVGDLSLTPLSEFTIHQADRSFGMNVSYVDKGQKTVLGSNAKRTLSLSIKQLVEKITQVEPYEPFWEHLEQLDLRDKRLTTLHKLDEFCEHLIELDASRNQITQLDGIPSSVRHLRINRNQISDLAAWGHLSNLQYIDVSDNQIESLTAFRNLHHLRGLKADRNKIKSLDGIKKLDGLIQLRLRANEIEFLDFAGTTLSRLTDLDLKDNSISQVRNLHELQGLATLNLEENDLSQLTTTQPLRALRYLKLSSNQLEKMDVDNFPDLRLLYVDDNRLESIQGLLKTKYLDTLSMREQQEGVYIDPTFLSQALEVRKLFLSGNLLTTFQPQVEYLNLQYLELANCGLEALSPEFGYMIPNVRVLNLNFNALRDVRPLSGIARLKRLHLAGNRLVRLRSTTSLISQMPTLAVVDLRNNPFTQGFYPSLTETRLIFQEDEVEEEISGQPFVLKDASRVEDEKYARRLDGQTKMMRRLFEIMVLSGCGRLKVLDGLLVNRSVLDARDSVWKALVFAGILRAEEARDNEEGGRGADARLPIREGKPELFENKENTRMSERWHAEDSFA